MSTNPTAVFNNASDAAEKLATLRNDAGKPQGPTGTYHSRAQSELGQELGRFAHLTRGQQSVVGATSNIYPAAASWTRDPVPDEKPLGYSVNDLPDLTRVK
jgi:hypothetical protein